MKPTIIDCLFPGAAKSPVAMFRLESTASAVDAETHAFWMEDSHKRRYNRSDPGRGVSGISNVQLEALASDSTDSDLQWSEGLVTPDVVGGLSQAYWLGRDAVRGQRKKRKLSRR